MQRPNIRVVLLGKTGCGKSSLCRILFGSALTPIDTPGFFGLPRSEGQRKDEMMRSMMESAPGPHAFLILLKVEKFTSQEKQTIEKIVQSFSEGALQYAVVVFTHGDNLPEGTRIKEFVQQNQGLHDLVRRCGGRCHVFDSRYWENNQQHQYRSNQFQLGELLATIERMVEEHHGGCYTSDMLQQVERTVQEEEAHIRCSRAGTRMSQVQIREQAKANVFRRYTERPRAVAIMFFCAFVGVPAILGFLVSLLARPAAAAGGLAAAAGALAAAAGGAAVGGCAGLQESHPTGSARGAIAKTAQAICYMLKKSIRRK